MSFRHFAIKISAQTRSKTFWSKSNHNPDSFVLVGKLAICHTDKRIFTTQKIKQGLRLVLCEIAYSMSIPSSQCTFHGFIKHIFRKRNVRCCELHERTECTVGTYLVSNFLRGTCALSKKGQKLVSNQTDSSVSVDERQIKESRVGWQRSLPLPDLSRKIEGPLLAGYCFFSVGLTWKCTQVTFLCGTPVDPLKQVLRSRYPKTRHNELGKTIPRRTIKNTIH